MIRGVVLFPGAGSSADHPSLLASQQALQPLPVARVDFPYRRAGRRAPDRAPVLVQAVREAIADVCAQWSCRTTDLVIGGRSMGGRVCSLAVAGYDGNHKSAQPVDAPLAVAGLVCVAYPLHPPGEPQKLRIAHLPHLAVPSLFVSGTRDQFGTPEELRRHLGVVRGPSTLKFIDGARHDLRGKDTAVADLVAAWVKSLNN